MRRSLRCGSALNPGLVLAGQHALPMDFQGAAVSKSAEQGIAHRPLAKSCAKMLPEVIQRGTPDSGWFVVLWDGDQVYGRISIVKLESNTLEFCKLVITCGT